MEAAFDRKFSNRFHIHRTRQNFAADGIDTFEAMADKGVAIVERVIKERMKGEVDKKRSLWVIPATKSGQ